MSKYKKIHQAFTDLQSGLDRARVFYSEMKDTVDSLQKNVDSFVNNRRSEGHSLLTQIEASKSASGGAQADREQQRLKDLMERMAINPAVPSPLPQHNHPQPPPRPAPLNNNPSYSNAYHPAASPQVTAGYAMHSATTSVNTPQYAAPRQGGYGQHAAAAQSATSNMPSYQQQAPQTSTNGGGYGYNPNSYAPMSSPPPPTQQQQQQQGQFFSPPPGTYGGHQSPAPAPQQQQQPQQGYPGQQQMPMGYNVPPPPPGPPPVQQSYGGYPPQNPQQQQQGGGDPWAGLSAWK